MQEYDFNEEDLDLMSENEEYEAIEEREYIDGLIHEIKVEAEERGERIVL